MDATAQIFPQELIEKVAGEFLVKFRQEVEKSDTDLHYFALISSVLLFNELVLINFSHQLELELEPSDSSQEIIQALLQQVKKIATNIDQRVNFLNVN